MCNAVCLPAKPTSDGPKERVTDKVNKEIMTQLLEMGFPEIRAEKGLWLTGTIVVMCFCVRPC